MSRKYELRRRAQRQEETRQRIVEAAIHLHQTVGKTSISAIAEEAGVERLTVYRHFPDERTLFTACTSHYLAQNPPPDPASWQDLGDAEERLRRALSEIYAYHRRTEQMSTFAMRGIEEEPVLREVLAPYFAYWEHVRDVLAQAWQTQDTGLRTRIRVAIGHAISFPTWRSLVREQGLEDAEAVELMVGMMCCLDRDGTSDFTEHSSGPSQSNL